MSSQSHPVLVSAGGILYELRVRLSGSPVSPNSPNIAFNPDVPVGASA